ncbi:MAG: zinc ribbon domain-containing protein, partial [Enterococcus faecalis]|nr:zinc ribbon domain-containing protein [Enterococcus faecalis]
GEEIQTSKETIGENDFVEALSDNPTLQLNFPLAGDYDARKALETFYQAFAKQVKSHTDSTEFAKKYLVGGENNPQFPSFIEALERLREKKSTDVSPDFEVTINTLQLDGKENYHVNYYLEAKNSKAKENGLRYEWINGLNDQIHLVKEPLKEGQLQFVSIDEQTLAWLEKIL